MFYLLWLSNGFLFGWPVVCSSSLFFAIHQQMEIVPKDTLHVVQITKHACQFHQSVNFKFLYRMRLLFLGIFLRHGCHSIGKFTGNQCILHLFLSMVHTTYTICIYMYYFCKFEVNLVHVQENSMQRMFGS